jgi:8-oxo-dGTP pyrophosphatase MutT (NUDIX family)
MGVRRATKQSARSLRKPQTLKTRRQVAAVCYRVRGSGIEFLLVQTRDGRWIFPKGGVEPGLTPAQSAALEAVEEAGVHGRIEELPFTRYLRCKQGTLSDRPVSAVTAHLCEVSRLERPQESKRKPTWFSAKRTKQRLIADRAPDFGAELVAVVDRALSRIQRLRAARNSKDGLRPESVNADGLNRIQFEAFEDWRLTDALKTALMQVSLRRKGRRIAPEPPVLRLSSGINSSDHSATAVHAGLSARFSKSGDRALRKA